MASNQTSNYQLHLWEPGDDFLREEFNENSERVDEAIAAVEAAGLKLTVNSYTGDGTVSRTHTFPFPPKLVLFTCNTAVDNRLFLVRGQTTGTGHGKFDTVIQITWSDRNVTLTGQSLADPSSSAICNIKDYRYCCCAIG